MTVTINLGRAARLLLGVAAFGLFLWTRGEGVLPHLLALPLLWVAAWQAGPFLRAYLNLGAVVTAALLALSLAPAGAWRVVLALAAAAVVTAAFPLSQRAVPR